MSVSCSRDILLDCIFLQIEKGVFSLPIIFVLTFFSVKTFSKVLDITLKVFSLSFLFKASLSTIRFRASGFSS